MKDSDALQERFSSVLAEAEAEQMADARAVAEAVYAEVSLADRLRAGLGLTVVLRIRGGPAQPLVGTLTDINREAVTVDGPGARRWVIRSGALELVRGLPDRFRPDTGSVPGRLGLAASLRPLVGQRVTCTVGERCEAGLLRRVGRDHLELMTTDGCAVVALGAVGWVRTD